jgi:phytanoyl-CoA hydroxylase
MAQDADFFHSNGFLVLNGFYSTKEVDKALDASRTAVKKRPMEIVVDNLDTGERTLAGMLPQSALQDGRFKVNDLHLDVDAVRNLALSPRIVAILKTLLGQTPVLCNSLFFEKGSAQPPHVDSLYMTPKTPGHLIAIWVALEDSHADAGQLEYFPGSHQIEQMKFSNNSYHFIPGEMLKWDQYMQSAVASRGLEKKRFSAVKGDVFIWHAHLLHGGGPIADRKRTRKSLVFHYYSESDCRGLKLVPEGDSLWLKRPPQDVGNLAEEYQAFTEKSYLASNPDVAAAVANGSLESAWAHFAIFGHKEGRRGAFSEEAYLKANPDVAKGVAGGAVKSATEHYFRYGRQERRKLR